VLRSKLLITSGHRQAGASDVKVRFGSGSRLLALNIEPELRIQFRQPLNLEPERRFRFSSAFECV
jgi:hypothetical protein